MRCSNTSAETLWTLLPDCCWVKNLLQLCTLYVTKLKTNFITFDDFLVGDFESMTTYLTRRKFSVIVFFQLIYTVVCYLAYAGHPAIIERFAFVAMLSFALYIVIWIIPEKTIDYMHYTGVIYMICVYLIAIYQSYRDPQQAMCTVSFMFISFCFVIDNCAVGFCVTCLTSILGTFMWTPDKWSTIRTLAVFGVCCTFLWALMKTHGLILTQYLRRYFKTREECAAEAQSKTMFMASVSHDLKNPLNSLLGCIDQLKNSATLSRNERRHLKTASFSGQILTYLINNILDITKIQVGKFEVDRLPMSITDELNKILRIERQLSKKKGISLYKKFLTPLPKLVYGDPMRFAEILINFIGNSIKFTSRGYVAVVFRWGKTIQEIEDLGANSELIPTEEYFAPARALRKKRSLFPKAHHEDETAGNEDDVNEDINELIYEKIPRYSLAAKPRLKDHHKFGAKLSYSYSVLSPSARMATKVKVIHSNDIQGLKNSVSSDSNRAGTGSRTVIGPYRRNMTYRTIHTEENGNSDESDDDDQIGSSDVESLFDFDNNEDFGDTGILALDIIDTGVGMNKEEQDRLFKPFSQANSSIKSQFGGTGLGLWISKQLIHLMSGFVELKSCKGKGSRFRITLPLKVVNVEAACSMRSIEDAKNTSELSIPKRFMLTHSFSRLALEMRSIGRTKFCGGKGILNNMKVLLVEYEKAKDDWQLEQIVNQLRSTDCEIFYSPYTSLLKILKEANYRFDAMLILAGTQSLVTKKLVTLLMKCIKDAGVKPIPYAVATGKPTFFVLLFTTIKNKNKKYCIDIAMQWEYAEISKEFMITFPLKDGDLEQLLMRMRSKYTFVFFCG